MKNFTRIDHSSGRFRIFSLIDDEGDISQAFDLFVNALVREDLQPQTVEAYSNRVASFLDYLTEAKVFGVLSSRLELMSAIKSYLPARISGKNASGKYSELSRNTLQQSKLKKSSAKNHAAAINKFLFDSDNYAVHLQQIDDWERGVNGVAPRSLFAASARRRSSSEIKKICQSSMMVNVMRCSPTLAEGKYLHVKGSDSQNLEDKDFPAAYLMALLDSASCARDEAIWALQAGTGLRPSEAIRLQMDDIDFKRRTVVVPDPENRRFASQMPDEFRKRWKGRAVSATYFIPALGDRFFTALEKYIRNEYSPRSSDAFVFQSVKGDNKPYVLVSDKSRIQSFNRACLRIQRHNPEAPCNLNHLSPHSLRHFYGTFMLNYVIVGNGQYGLRPVEVQRLMGHERLETTMKYARQDKIALEAKMMFMHSVAMNDPSDVNQVVKWIAEKYIHSENRLNKSISRESP
jgi:integrase